MNDSEVTRARTAERLLRATFEAAKEREWAQISAAAHARTVDAVWAARQAGVSVSQIAREYGTTSRSTIYALLAEREQYNTLTPAETNTDTSVTVEPYVNSDGYPHAHHVRVVNYGQTGYTGGIDVYRATPDGPIMPIPGTFEAGSELHQAIITQESSIINSIKEVMG